MSFITGLIIHIELNRDMGHHLYVYNEIADLLPQTEEKEGPGQFFLFQNLSLNFPENLYGIINEC